VLPQDREQRKTVLWKLLLYLAAKVKEERGPMAQVLRAEFKMHAGRWKLEFT
jgi:hypothetical protein